MKTHAKLSALSIVSRLVAAVATAAGAVACTASTSSPSTGPSAPAAPEAKSDQPRAAASSVPAADLSAAVTTNNAFAVDLFTHLRAGSTGNLFTSPISASLALTMAYAGARGQTATEMAQALHLGSDPSEIFAGQNAIDQGLESYAANALASDTKTAQESEQPAPSASNYDLHVVNSVWGEQTFPWEQPFLDLMATDYGAGIYLEDFIHQPDQARVAINDWVSEETSNRINDLLPPSSIDGSTRMVLVNAIHLKLPWIYPFQTAQTAPATFTRADGSTVSVPLMHMTQELGYDDDGKAQIVALPLSGNMNVVLALPHGDLASYEASLSASSELFNPPAEQSDVVLSLPKVSFTSSTLSLRDALQAMGMKQAFIQGTADFTGLCAPPDGESLYVSDVLQKTMLGIQETGVEAAAATAVPLAYGSEGPPQTVTMTLDRPFLVSIVDTSGAVLFLGDIEDPSQSGQ